VLTVLSADLVGFTSRFETMDPEDRPRRSATACPPPPRGRWPHQLALCSGRARTHNPRGFDTDDFFQCRSSEGRSCRQ